MHVLDEGGTEMDIRDPKEYFPSYLRYLFEKTLSWPIFRIEQGIRRPCAKKLIDNYISLCTSGASLYADKNIKIRADRDEYIKWARRIAEDNVANGEETMKQIVHEYQNNTDLMGIGRWRHLNEKFKVAIQDSKFGNQIERALFFAEGKTPKGDEFSEVMKDVANRLITDIDLELDCMVKFMEMYLSNKEEASERGTIK